MKLVCDLVSTALSTVGHVRTSLFGAAPETSRNVLNLTGTSVLAQIK